MKVYIANESKMTMGGGWSFIDNLVNALKDRNDITFTTGADNADGDHDLVFVAGTTMIQRDTLMRSLEGGKKLVVRVDNIPEDRNNRGTGWSRLRDYVALADFVVFQSKWAMKLISPALTFKKDAKKIIIHNGVDVDFFTPNGPKFPDLGDHAPIFLYLLSSGNENKRVGEVIYLYREYYNYAKTQGLNPLLILAGRGFPRELAQYHFEFHNGEPHIYMGEVDRNMAARLMRSADGVIANYYADACPNTVLEAMASGANVLYHPYGGARELLGEHGVPLDYIEWEPEALMSALTTNINKDLLRNRVVNKFTNKHMAYHYMDVFRDVLK